jgi:hypothetical protein
VRAIVRIRFDTAPNDSAVMQNQATTKARPFTEQNDRR